MSAGTSHVPSRVMSELADQAPDQREDGRRAEWTGQLDPATAGTQGHEGGGVQIGRGESGVLWAIVSGSRNGDEYLNVHVWVSLGA